MEISVVIPTFRRRDLVARNIEALGKQDFTGEFEVIVVVDGSDDGTAEHVRSLDVRFPLTVLEQTNRGAAAARNFGASGARGPLLLFIDDDMEADSSLLREHLASHDQGADVVLGHMPVHPDSPSGFLAQSVKAWTEGRLERLTRPGAELTLHDLLTGQISIQRKVFDREGGFDTSFTSRGSYGGEDIDFGYRMQSCGLRIVFNPRAITWQHYHVSHRAHLQQWYLTGIADVAFSEKHPAERETLFVLNGSRQRLVHYAWRPLVATPVIATVLGTLSSRLALLASRLAPRSPAAGRLFSHARAIQYWTGVRYARTLSNKTHVRVLAYHSVRSDPVHGPQHTFTLTPKAFGDHLDALTRAGFTFVDASQFSAFIRGKSQLPSRAILLTFDDCYEDLEVNALPILAERGIPAIAFAVSGRIGATNTWDSGPSFEPMRLLDGDAIRRLAASGVEVGSHSRTHADLSGLPPDSLEAEVAGSMEELAALGLPRPGMFSYPYGSADASARAAVARAGYTAAFTTKYGSCRQGDDPFLLPRIEIKRRDVGLRFLLKVTAARHLRTN